MTSKNIVQRWQNKETKETLTANFDTSIVRIKYDNKKVEELVTKKSFFYKMEKARWEQIS